MLKDELPKIVTQTVPGPKAAAVLARRRQAIPDAIGTIYPTVIKRGEGAMFEDVDGNYFLDWVGGVGVLNIGYSQPEVVKAVQDQAGNYFHAMANIVTHEGYVALAEKLNAIAPVKGDKNGRSSSTAVPKPTKMPSKSLKPIRNGRISSSSPVPSTAARS